MGFRVEAPLSVGFSGTPPAGKAGDDATPVDAPMANHMLNLPHVFSELVKVLLIMLAMLMLTSMLTSM